MYLALLLKEERRTKCIRILLLEETNLTLSTTTKNLIININRTSSFKCFFFDNIFVQFEALASQQTIGIPIGANCGSLLADLLLQEVRWTSFKGFSRVKIENYQKPFILVSAIQMMFNHWTINWGRLQTKRKMWWCHLFDIQLTFIIAIFQQHKLMG